MEFCWKFYGSVEFKIVLFGLLLSLSALNGVESDCNYFQNLEAGKKYYVYNQEYPNSYNGTNHCVWKIQSPYIVQMNCCIEMNSNDCYQNILSVQFDESNRLNYCRSNTFTLEGMNPTITFDSQYKSQGRFLCEIQNNWPCGWKKVTRIVGGMETGVNEYPMMAGLVDVTKEMLYCGCTIISNQYVVTAAHCVFNRNSSNIGVIVGEHDVTTGSETNATKLFRIIGYEIHPLYESNTNAYDVAVCKINGIIEYSAEIGPACLPFQHNRDSFGGSIVTALGWGLLEFAGRKPTVLQGVDLNVMTLKKCESYYADLTNNSNNNICTYTPRKDTCQMDSGGPILWQNPTTHNLVLVGITSTGEGCASDKPAVAMRVGAFIDWIVYITRGVEYCQVE